jgi:hypothetical protein
VPQAWLLLLAFSVLAAPLRGLPRSEVPSPLKPLLVERLRPLSADYENAAPHQPELDLALNNASRFYCLLAYLRLAIRPTFRWRPAMSVAGLAGSAFFASPTSRAPPGI